MFYSGFYWIFPKFCFTREAQCTRNLKSHLAYPVVNWKNSIFLQLLYIWYFHLTKAIDFMLPIGLWPINCLGSYYWHPVGYSFHYPYSIRILFICCLWVFSILVLLLERCPAILVHKHDVHVWNSSSNTSIVTVYDCTKIVVDDQPVKLKAIDISDMHLRVNCQI